MWYSGYDGGNYRTGYALSNDGISWTKYSGGPVVDLGPSGSWDDSGILEPVVIFDGSEYKMWYGGIDGTTWRIGYATSSNGIDWTRSAINPVLSLGGWRAWDDTHVQSPAVIYDGATYNMWYSGSDGVSSTVGYATSPDGINWTKYVYNPVMYLGSAGYWDDGHIFGPTVVYDEVTYKMWFGGHDGIRWRIGHATVGYPALGSLVSVVFDSHAYGSFWNFVNWTEYLPPGTNITLATRSGNSSTPTGAWSQWSPEMWNETESPITSPRSRYLQYRATLTTTNQSLSPILSDVNVNYTANTAQIPLLLSPANNTWTPNNRPNLTWSFGDLEGDSQGGFGVLIDDNSTFTSIDYYVWNMSSNHSYWTPSFSIDDGVWYWRVLTRDSFGQWSKHSDYSVIMIDTIPPSANAGFDVSVNEDGVVVLNGSASEDFGLISFYNWSFDDGDYYNGSDPTPSHTYMKSGVYNVILNVTDAVGFWNLDSVLVFVNNVNPVANAGQDISIDEGQAVVFDGSATYDTQSDMTSLIHTWYFGDGSISSGVAPTHTYNDDGSYAVTLVVEDDDGATNSDTLTVDVRNVDPVISTVGPQTAIEGKLFALQISADDVSGDKLSFSDDSPMFEIDHETGMISFTPTDSDVGAHTVTVEVRDDDGGLSAVNFAIDIQNVNDKPVITSTAPGVAMAEALYEYDVLVWDDDFLTPSGDLIVYRLEVHPPGMTVDSSGRIAWTPTNDQGGGSWNVIVNVSDGEAYVRQTFTVDVQLAPEPANHAPVLEDPKVLGVPGLESTFLFSTIIMDEDGDAPDKVLVIIDGATYEMSGESGEDYEVGVVYELQLQLEAGGHTYWFKVYDADGAYASTSSKSFEVEETPVLDLVPILLTILLIVGVILILLQVLLMKRKKPLEDEPPPTA
jgi:PKD repeat protein